MDGEKQDQLIMECANHLVPFMQSLDPGWASQIDAMKGERGFDNLQVIAALAGNTLQQEMHMSIPPHPFFFDTHVPAGKTMQCQICHRDWIVAYPGQPVCSNECAVQYYAQQKEREAANEALSANEEAGHNKVEGKPWRAARKGPREG